MDLNLFWFILLGVLLIGYAILDGFDLGVGILHPLAKTDHERRVFMNSIGPLWDGNEVWLVTFGGALFAAFPHVYASAFSGFYLPFMLLLFALISRAVSMEFRSKRESRFWRGFFDYGFFVASALAALLFGVAVGNAIRGLPIGPDFEFVSEMWYDNLLYMLNWYGIIVGLFVVAMFAMHGAMYLYLKTEGELQDRIYNLMWTTFGIFLIMYLFTTIASLVAIPAATENFKNYPLAWIVVVLNVLAIANIPRSIFQKKPLQAFASSCCTIAALVFLFMIALFPNLLVTNLADGATLTIYNAASSQKTLWIMAIIAVLGMPFVLTYTAVIYWTFRGKVEIGKFSY